MASTNFRRIHLYTFRTLLVTTVGLLLSASANIYYWEFPRGYEWLQVALRCGVFLHHASSVFPLTALPNLLDLLLVLAELSVWFALLGKFPKMFKFNPWAPQSYSIFLVSMHVQVAVLFVLLGIRSFRLIRAGRKGLFTKFEFEPAVGQQTPVPWYYVMFGTSLFKERYRDEPPFIRGLRALVAYILIIALVVYSLFVLVVGPVQETALPPVKTFRGFDLLDSQFTKLDPFVWRIFVLLDARTARLANITSTDLQNSINVTALWDNEGPIESCRLDSQEVRHHNSPLSMRSDPVDFITFLCPSRYDAPSSNPTGDDFLDKYYDNSNLAPDLLVTVNFTSLNISSDSLANARRRAISILVGLTNNDLDVITNTVPTPLFPGSHMYGSVSRQVRQISVPHSLASLGTFSFSRTFLTAHLTFLATDPSPLISRLENTATLRIYTQNDPSDWTIVQDYRENYVLDGLADVGGFWAFVNGLFAVFFGSTLAMIIFGAKPLSIFGILDRVGPGRRKLREHFQDEYPQLKEEASSGQRGLLAFVREHFVDLNILYHEELTATRSPHAEMIEQGSFMPN